MKDYFGNELHIDDEVAFYAPDYRRFATGTVVDFTPQKVRVKYMNTWNFPSKGQEETYLAYPNMLIRKPPEHREGKLKEIPPVVLEDGTVDDWQRPLTQREELRRFRRVGGDCICEICGYRYADHPDETRIVSGIDGKPFMKRLCNGWLGKL